MCAKKLMIIEIFLNKTIKIKLSLKFYKIIIFAIGTSLHCNGSDMMRISGMFNTNLSNINNI